MGTKLGAGAGVVSCAPITEIFAGLHTHKERAKWLLSVSLDVILRDHLALLLFCRSAGFQLGEAYITAEVSALSSVRVSGELRPWHQNSVQTLRAMMRETAGYEARKRWKFW